MIGNTLEDLLSEKVLNLYSTTEYPFNLSILHNTLSAKLKEDPGYELWAPLVYYRNALLTRKNKDSLEFRPYKVFISNKGNVCSLRDTKPKMLNHIVSGEYTVVSVPTGKKKNQSVVLHRAMACSFLSLDRFLLSNEGVNKAHPKDLQVNHIDGIKANFDMGNLEWVTSLGNVLHALENNLIRTGSACQFTKPIKGMVLVGPYLGYSFILHGSRECASYGFKQPNVNACVLGRRSSHRGCRWIFATDEEVKAFPHGIPQDILDDISRRRRLGRGKSNKEA